MRFQMRPIAIRVLIAHKIYQLAARIFAGKVIQIEKHWREVAVSYIVQNDGSAPFVPGLRTSIILAAQVTATGDDAVNRLACWQGAIAVLQTLLVPAYETDAQFVQPIVDCSAYWPRTMWRLPVMGEIDAADFHWLKELVPPEPEKLDIAQTCPDDSL